jgi:hypothetical protein
MLVCLVQWPSYINLKLPEKISQVYPEGKLKEVLRQPKSR